MALKKPNTLCKNANCNKGENGGRKHYYSCRFCVREENWRSMACSWECFMEYNDQVMRARSGGIVIDMLADRTDMTKDEVKSLLDTPVEQVVEQTELELAEEIEENPSKGFDEIVDQINAELDSAAKISKKRKKGSQ